MACRAGKLGKPVQEGRVVIGDHFAPGEEAECTGRSIGGIRSGRKWCNILLPATIWVRDVLTFGGNDLPCDVRCLPGRIGVQRGDAQLAAATELAHGDSLAARRRHNWLT